jgi:hypothetical protein
MDNESKITIFKWESTAQVLIRCFWIGAAFNVLWALCFLTLRDWQYEFVQNYISLTRDGFDLLWLSWISVWKFGTLACLVPYFAILHMLGGKQ